MRRTSMVLFALVASLLGACADVGDPVGGDDFDVKKRTAPKAGMGAVTLVKPAWFDATRFRGEVVVTGDKGRTVTALKPGAQVDVAPGQYLVHFRPEGVRTMNTDGYYLGVPWQAKAYLSEGAVWKVEPAGLRLQFDRALVWPGQIALGEISVPTPGSAVGYGINTLSLSDKEIAAGVASIDRLLPAGSYMLAGKNYGGAPTITLAAGQLSTIPLPTVSIDVALDEVDPAFPDVTVPNADCVTVEALRVKEPVRRLGAFATAILPEAVEVTAQAFGLAVPSQVAGGVRHFVLNRLELGDVRVVDADGNASHVRGHATIEQWTGSGWTTLRCGQVSSFPTRTGLDIPDGRYRITSGAPGPNGVVTDVEEVSFP